VAIINKGIKGEERLIGRKLKRAYKRKESSILKREVI
jgi:hypothetical protein